MDEILLDQIRQAVTATRNLDRHLKTYPDAQPLWTRTEQALSLLREIQVILQGFPPELRRRLAEILARITSGPGKEILTERLAQEINEAFGKDLPDHMLVSELLLTGDKHLRWHPVRSDCYIFHAYDGTEYTIQKAVVQTINQPLGRADRFQYRTIGSIRDTDEDTLEKNVPALGQMGIRFMQQAFARR